MPLRAVNSNTLGIEKSFSGIVHSFFTHSSILMICMGDLLSTDGIVAIGVPLNWKQAGCDYYIPCLRPRRRKISPAGACYHCRNMSPQDAVSPFDLLGKSPEELRSFVQSLGEPAYRGGQIYHAIYAERRFDFAAMSNLPAALRKRLERESIIALPKVRRRYESSDGAVRYVLE